LAALTAEANLLARPSKFNDPVHAKAIATEALSRAQELGDR